MPSKIWAKYKMKKEIESKNSNIKTYLARIELIIKEIIPKNKDDYYTIIERIEKIKEEKEINIYETIEENERIYIVIDNNKELISEIEKLILSDELDIEKEGIVKGHGRPITKKEIYDLLEMEKSMCKISYETEKGEIGRGSGFFCEIDNFPIKYALFTNNHILNKSNLKIGKIINLECLELRKSLFSSSYAKIQKQIKMTEERKIFTNKEFDYTCIELFISDKIINYFKIDPNLYKNNKNILKDNDIFILQYPNGEELSFSYGKISSLENNKMVHTSSTDRGSSGSPIIRRCKDIYIIGLHIGGVKKKETKRYKYNLGTSFDLILNNLREQNYIINCIYIPDNDDIKINLLHDYNIDKQDWDKNEKISYLEAKNNISEENIEIYINDNKIKFDYKYEIKDSKEIKVKFIFKKLLTNTNHMFYECKSLKSIDLSSLSTNNTKDMSYMFYGCSSLESIDLSSSNTANVNNMSYMFYGCSTLKSIDLSSFNTTHVNNMSNMFYGCFSLESLDLSLFNTTNVKNMSSIFKGCSSLESLNLSSFNTTNVNNMSYMFAWCSSLKSLNLSSFNTTNVNNMNCMFYNCYSLKSLDLSSFNTTNVNNMRFMFSHCYSLESIDLSSFKTTNVNNMSGMFNGLSSLKAIDLSSFNTTNVNNMSYMFSHCSSLKSLNLSSFNINNNNNMRYMFYNCSSLKSLDLPSVNKKNLNNNSDMFYYCFSLESLNLSSFTII